MGAGELFLSGGLTGFDTGDAAGAANGVPVFVNADGLAVAGDSLVIVGAATGAFCGDETGADVTGAAGLDIGVEVEGLIGAFAGWMVGMLDPELEG